MFRILLYLDWVQPEGVLASFEMITYSSTYLCSNRLFRRLIKHNFIKFWNAALKSDLSCFFYTKLNRFLRSEFLCFQVITPNAKHRIFAILVCIGTWSMVFIKTTRNHILVISIQNNYIYTFSNYWRVVEYVIVLPWLCPYLFIL